MNLKFDENGLVPAIVQDLKTRNVLMLGYMNQEALDKTEETKKVTFYSRSKQRLWVKGETSGNFLNLVYISADCDQDALLITASPEGPTCHTGSVTCWGEPLENTMEYLERTIEERKKLSPEQSYIAGLFEKGINKIAQKVGEEAVEMVIEAKDNNDTLFLSESADLFFHYLMLLNAKGFRLEDILEILEARKKG